MLKINLLLILIVLSVLGKAQTFTWITNDTIIDNLAQNTTVLLKMEQEPINNDTLTLGIEVIYNDIPQSWDGMVCVQGKCFGFIPPVGFTNTMVPIYQGYPGYVRLTINPLDGTETAKLQIAVYDVNYPQQRDTATWILNPSGIGISEVNKVGISVFPVPSGGEFRIFTERQISFIEIVDLKGRSVYSRFVNFSNAIEVKEQLLPGIYFVRLFGKGWNEVQKIVIN